MPAVVLAFLLRRLLDMDQGRLFVAATRVTKGDRNTTRCWAPQWLGSDPLCYMYPAMFKHTRRKNQAVAEASTDDWWVNELCHGNTMQLFHEFVELSRQLNPVGMVLTAE
ncbi:hypothetical protein D1007_29158 [Hordeum vulgare]|nr:hypothetical protein D1007_29158 [Hordeum vulgare]